MPNAESNAERQRLAEDATRQKNWKRWGPYLSERQWGTVREDYSADGSCWDYLPHDHARSRAYRWGEDGLLGLCDREGRMCFALALWNGRDPILKERLFGLSSPEGNHGEDVKECYFYLDSTPTHSYMKALYKYPQAEFPYRWLVEENRRRSRKDPEFELLDTGVFSEDRYFDIFAEYAKADTDDVLIRITAVNRGPDASTLHLLPTLWFRNTWSWGRSGEGYWPKPKLWRPDDRHIAAEHASLGKFQLEFDAGAEVLFTDNETNFGRLFGLSDTTPYVKDSFDDYVIHGRQDAVNPQGVGTKAAVYYKIELAGGESRTFNLRLSALPLAGNGQAVAPGPLFEQRMREADEFYARLLARDEEARGIMRQAYAGLLWTKQFYHYSVVDWLEGDPASAAVLRPAVCTAGIPTGLICTTAT